MATVLGFRVAAVAAVAAFGVAAAVAREAPANDVQVTQVVRSVDYTYICSTLGYGNLRKLKISGRPSDVYPGYPAHLTAYTNRGSATEGLVSAEAGASSGRLAGGVYVHRRLCKQTRARIPLSREGLPGPATFYARQFDCQVARRVILRVRAVLHTAGPWMRFGKLMGVRRDVRTAAVAIRTYPARKPLGYATFDGRGNISLFAAAGCR